MNIAIEQATIDCRVDMLITAVSEIYTRLGEHERIREVELIWLALAMDHRKADQYRSINWITLSKSRQSIALSLAEPAQRWG
jgi:hypothetical protein